MPLSKDERDGLIGRHGGLALSIARQHICSRGGCEGLRQSALVALVEAVDRYDPEAEPGTSLEAYARAWIHMSLDRHCFDCKRHWDRGQSERWAVDCELSRAIRSTLRDMGTAVDLAVMQVD
jgi:DNA-directed RNA polymerase specialized sigma subunit